MVIQGFTSELQALQSLKSITWAYAETVGNGIEVVGIKVVQLCFGSKECLVFFKETRRRFESSGKAYFNSSLSGLDAPPQLTSLPGHGAKKFRQTHSSHKRTRAAEQPLRIEMHVQPEDCGNLTAVLQSAKAPGTLPRFASTLSSLAGLTVTAAYTKAPEIVDLGPRPPPVMPPTKALDGQYVAAKTGECPWLTCCGQCIPSIRALGIYSFSAFAY